MVKFEFYLSEEDFDRLYEIKNVQGKDHLTGNEFARELLTRELHRLHPGVVQQNDADEG